MNAVERLKWLQAEIDVLVSRYQNDSRDYKKQAFRLRIVSVLLAAIVTVLLGLKLKDLQRDLRFWAAGRDPNVVDAAEGRDSK